MDPSSSKMPASGTPRSSSTPVIPPSTTPVPPVPTAFDLLPALHALISRLDTAKQANSEPDAMHLVDLPPISAKDLPAMTDDLKIQLQKARQAIHLLPDMDRTVEEQEGELKELDEKIAMQKEVLEMLRRGGRAQGMDMGPDA